MGLCFGVRIVRCCGRSALAHLFFCLRPRYLLRHQHVLDDASATTGGADTVACFKIDQTGALAPAGHAPAGHIPQVIIGVLRNHIPQPC